MTLPHDRPALLSDLIAETAWMEIACRRCERRGRLRVSELFAFYGPDERVWTAVEDASADCPRKANTQTYEICQVSCPSLSRYSRIGPETTQR